MRVLVVGFSVSGRAASELLLVQGKEVLAVDQKAKAMRAELEVESLCARGVALIEEGEKIAWEEVEQVVLSPGVSLEHMCVKEAQARGIEVAGEVEVAFRALENPAIGITGTNGKTTVALLTTHILRESGRKARALGNIGQSLSGYATRPEEGEILVVELSSFQLETLEKKCLDVAVCLNITPDHLDRYGSMVEYAKVKCRIEDCLKENGEFFVSRKVTEDWGELLKRPRIFEESLIAPNSSMSYTQLGLPEWPNVQAVYPLCRHFGIGEKEFMRGLQTFRKPKHRIEYLGEMDGIAFYNDSKATNIDAVQYAVSLLDGPIILLVGGVDKGASYRPWIEAFGSKVRRIVAFGQAAPKLEAELGSAFAFARTESMQDALVLAVKMAEAPMAILLSPGCSSYDAFRSYEHRGNEFKRMVEEKVWIEEKRS